MELHIANRICAVVIAGLMLLAACEAKDEGWIRDRLLEWNHNQYGIWEVMDERLQDIVEREAKKQGISDIEYVRRSIHNAKAHD